MIDDKPIVFDDPDNAVRWKPDNFEEEFKGQLFLRAALRDSINSVAVRLADMVGIDDVIKNARRLGMTTPIKRELGTALGSSCTTLYDLMNVYTAFNQYGERRELTFVRRVVDRYGNVLEDHSVAWDPTNDLGTRLEIRVERQFGGVRRACDQRLSQPKPVLEPTNTQQNVPAIGGLPEFAGGHLGQSERISVGRGCALNNRNDCRQNFRCPEYGLILRRPRRVSHKSRGPISF